MTSSNDRYKDKRMKVEIETTKITNEQAADALTRGTKRVTHDDLKKVLDKSAEIEKKFKNHGSLSRFIEDLKLLFSLAKDYMNGTYRAIPWWSVAAIVAALFYVLDPIDLIPDFIPVIGYIDDAAVVAICLRMVEADLQKYEDWKKRNPE